MRHAWAAAATAILLWGCARDAPVALALRLEPGREWSVEVVSALTVTQTVGARVVTIRQKSALGITFRVVQRNAAGVMSLEAAYDYLALEVDGALARLSFDTREAGAGRPELAPLGGLVGRPFHFPVDPRGRVGSVTGLDRILADIVSTAAEGQAQTLSQALDPVLGPDAVRGSLASVFIPFPPDAVRIGDSWMTERNTGGSLAFVSRETWTLRSVSRGRAAISLQARTSGSRADARLEGSQNGSLVVDLGSGMVQSGSLRQEATGSFVLQGRGIPLEIEGSVEVRVE